MVNFLVAGDIGAAANVVRNIMLLSNDIHWPLAQPRLETVLNQYPEHLKTNMLEWIYIELKLRFFKEHYNIDISHDLNWNEYKQNIQETELPAVFINHSFVWEFDNFLTFAEHMPALIVMPTTDFGLEWQIRAYCEKKGVDIMHNFTFPDNVEEQKAKYIADHGQEAWNRENIANMRSVIKYRRDQIFSTHKDMILPLEWLIGPHDLPAINTIQEHFNIDIDIDQASQVLNTWRSRHWPVEQTLDWKYK